MKRLAYRLSVYMQDMFMHIKESRVYQTEPTLYSNRITVR